jgi:hypothetical protein
MDRPKGRWGYAQKCNHVEPGFPWLYGIREFDSLLWTKHAVSKKQQGESLVGAFVQLLDDQSERPRTWYRVVVVTPPLWQFEWRFKLDGC